MCGCRVSQVDNLSMQSLKSQVAQMSGMDIDTESLSQKSFSRASQTSSLVNTDCIFGLHSGPGDTALAFSEAEMKELISSSSLAEDWGDIVEDQNLMLLLHILTSGVVCLSSNL